MRRIFYSLAVLSCFVAAPASAQTFFKDNNIFQHLDASFTAGTTGIGFELATPVWSDMVRLRAGFSFMPHFEYPMHFSIQMFGPDGQPLEGEENDERFNRMAGYMEEMTGMEVDQNVEMIGEPSMHNFKLIADVFPLHDKRWYFSLGFMLGPSQIGYAYNTTEDMTTLMAVAMYNSIYDKVYDIEYNEDSELDGIFMGLELPPAINRKILNAGKMGMHVGDFKSDGSPYMMVPDQDNMVKARMMVNRFKPYLGAGFKGNITKDGKYGFAADCGILFWGGTPKVYTHDGTEIVSGLDNIWGQVGHYVDIVRPFKVFPMIELKFTRTIF